MKQERFDKIIATQFNISRRDARIAIRRGKATLNGKILRDFGALVEVNSDITFNGQALNYKKFIYILMNKPKGVCRQAVIKINKPLLIWCPTICADRDCFPWGDLTRTQPAF